MPGGSKGKSRAKAPSVLADSDDFLLYDDTEPTSSTTRGTKRRADDTDYGASNGVGEVEKMLANFGADFTKSIQNKRKKMDAFTQESIQSSNKKMVEINSKQNTERHKLIDSYSKQIETVLGQWEEDMVKMKEGEEKLTLIMKQHQKLAQQQRVVQTQRYKTIKQLQEEFTKNLELLEENHEKQISKMQDEMKEEMMQLRKKILMESQQQEMSSVRRSLQLLAQVGEE